MAPALTQKHLGVAAPRLGVLEAPVLRRPGPVAGRLVLAPAARPFAQPPRSLLQLDDPRHRAVEEGAVVRDDNHAPAHLLDEPLEPFQAVEVEIVRRLVEAEHVEPRQQQSREASPRSLTAGERLEGLLQPPIEAEAGADSPGSGLQVGAAQGEKPLERIRVGVGEPRLLSELALEPVQLRLDGSDARAAGEVGEKGLSRERVELLREVAGAQAGRAAPDRSTLGPGEPRQHAQERRLARAVRTHDAGAATGTDRQRRVLEDGDGAMGDGDIYERERGHGPPDEGTARSRLEPGCRQLGPHSSAPERRLGV